MKLRLIGVTTTAFSERLQSGVAAWPLASQLSESFSRARFSLPRRQVSRPARCSTASAANLALLTASG